MTVLSRRAFGAALLGVAAAAATTGLPGWLRAGTPQPRRHHVMIEAFAFAPAQLAIAAGDAVAWVNRDIAPHTATDTAEAWDTGLLQKAEVATVTFSTPGRYAYFCRFHPRMRAEIVVD